MSHQMSNDLNSLSSEELRREVHQREEVIRRLLDHFEHALTLLERAAEVEKNPAAIQELRKELSNFEKDMSELLLGQREVNLNIERHLRNLSEDRTLSIIPRRHPDR